MKFLLVGSAFHPGAMALLEHGLRQGARVELVPEPENPYDPQAVRVEVAPDQVVSGEALDAALAGFGLSEATLHFPFMLGHLGASEVTKAARRAQEGGVKFALVREWHFTKPAQGLLVFEGNGATTVEAQP